jgi:arsenate reductase-like glutaredoxin family protein
MPRTQAQIDSVKRFIERNPDRYKELQLKSAYNWRHRNIEAVREKDRLRKSPFIMEWKTLRNIDIF